jgi:amino acid transporter
LGIIIGAGIYQMAPAIAKGAFCWWGVLLIWVAGGLLSLCGALSYGELATAYPREGGDYVYLSRAYGRWAGFLFGWVQLAIVRPADIAVMAFAFGMYARQIWDPLASFPALKYPFGDTETPLGEPVYACAAVIILTVVNIIGVREGKWTQNVLTTIKALGLLAIVGVALAAPEAPARTASFAPNPISVALILVLFTYGGWNEMAYVAAEVRNPKRNIVRAMVLGMVTVTVIYVLVNGAFLYTLGYEAVATSDAVATDTVKTVFPKVGAAMISALVCISALGAVNGLIFTGARISYAVGSEHPAFRVLGRWDQRRGTPVRALLLQGAIAVGLVLALGSFVETIIYAAPTVYSFYLATSLAVIVLRIREPGVERPYRVIGYPVVPLVFAAVCGLLIYKAAEFAVVVLEKPWIVGTPLAIIIVGLPIYWLTTVRLDRRDRNRSA